MITIDDKIFILNALKGQTQFFLDGDNISTMLEIRNRIGWDKLDEIINILKGV
jgi:hypothetical protein